MANFFFSLGMCVSLKKLLLFDLKPWQKYSFIDFNLNFNQDYRNHGIVSVSSSFFPFPLSSIILLYPSFGIYKLYHVTETILGARDPEIKGYSLCSQETKSSWWERKIKNKLQYWLWSSWESLPGRGDGWAGRMSERWQGDKINLIWNINGFWLWLLSLY